MASAAGPRLAPGRDECAAGGRLPGLDGEQSAALQGAGPLGLGGGVAAQQGGVLAAQAGEFGAFGAELGVQAGADLARFLDVRLQFGDAFLGAPLVARPGPGQLGDPLAGLAVPGAQEDGAGDRGGRGTGGEHPLHEVVADEPCARGTGN
nr:hypothetical protein [Streptomyces noursei]